jgi:hypothetical protein
LTPVPRIVSTAPRLVINPTPPARRSFNNTTAPIDYQIQLHRLKEANDYRSDAAKEFLLASEDQFRAQNLLEIYADQCREFFARYCEETRAALSQSDQLENVEKARLNSLHLAAAMNDPLSVRIGLRAGISVNTLSEVWGSRRGDQFRDLLEDLQLSPLHACVLFNNNAKALVGLLLQNGSRTEGFGHECPLHLATFWNEVGVLEVFKEHRNDVFAALAPDLLQLAIERRPWVRDTVKFLVCHGAVDRQDFEPCPSRFLGCELQDRRSHKPLEAMMNRGWFTEAALILKRYAEIRAIPMLDFDQQGGDGTPLQRFLWRWMMACPLLEDEQGRNAVCWAASFGYDDLLERSGCSVLSQLTAQQRDSAMRLAWASENEKCVLLLLEHAPPFREAEFQALLKTRGGVLSEDALAILFAKTEDIKDWHLLDPPQVVECAFTRALDTAGFLGLSTAESLLLEMVGKGQDEGLFRLLQSAIVRDKQPFALKLASRIVSTGEALFELERFLQECSTALDLAIDRGYETLAKILFRYSLLPHERHPLERRWPRRSLDVVRNEKTHAFIARYCLELMSTALKKGICGLGLADIEALEALHAKLDKCLPLELQYACVHWIDHLRESRLPQRHNRVHAFLRDHLLHWLEATTLLLWRKSWTARWDRFGMSTRVDLGFIVNAMRSLVEIVSVRKHPQVRNGMPPNLT